MENNELKPCPFCGGEAEMRGKEFNDGTLFFAACKNEKCGAEGDVDIEWWKAVESWNSEQLFYVSDNTIAPCICGKKALAIASKSPDGFRWRIECSECAMSTAFCDTLDEAKELWKNHAFGTTNAKKATLTFPDSKEVHVYEAPDPFSPLALDENEIDAIRYLCSCAVVDHMLGRGVKFDISGSRAQLIMGIHEKCETALRESKERDKK